MKLLGMLLLTLSGGGIGWFRAAALQRRATSLSAVYRLIVWLSTRLRYTAAPAGQLLKQAASGEFSRLSLLQELDGQKTTPFPEAWRNAVAASEKENRFTPEDSRLLLEFGEGLGTTDLLGQEAHGEMYAALFRERWESADAEARAKGRMEMVLWLSGAAALSLLLI